MAIYHFSGVNTPDLLALLARKNASGMVNAVWAGQRAMVEAYTRYSSVPLVLDSGACQGYTNVEAYARLIRRIGPRMLWCSSMDVLHCQQKSDEQYQRLCALLADDQDLCTKIVWVYQCQSYGADWNRQGDLDALKRALEIHRFVAIGGLVSVIERSINEAQDLLGELGEVLTHAEASAHLFGIGSFALLTFCAVQRWFRSADSARWILAGAARKLLTTEGKYISARTLTFDRLACIGQNIGAMQAWLEPALPRQVFLFPDPQDTGIDIDSLTQDAIRQRA